MDEIWIEVRFDDQPMDNLITNSITEAEEIIKSIEYNGFENYNEEVKNDWINMGFRNNPIVTARLCD